MLMGPLLAVVGVYLGLLIYYKFVNDAGTPKMTISDRNKEEFEKDFDARKKHVIWVANVTTLSFLAVGIVMVASFYISGRFGIRKLVVADLLFLVMAFAIRQLQIYIHTPRE